MERWGADKPPVCKGAVALAEVGGAWEGHGPFPTLGQVSERSGGPAAPQMMAVSTFSSTNLWSAMSGDWHSCGLVKTPMS